MKTVRIIIALLLIIPAPDISGQTRKDARIANMDISVDNYTNLKIAYNIINSDSSRTHEVNIIFFNDNDSKAMFPRTLRGDFGLVKGSPGKKVIEWEITKDFNSINEDFYPMIILDGRDRISGKTGGWKNVFLSLAVPGLGDYFVADPYDMKIKPWMRTTSVIAFLGMGYYCQKERIREEIIELDYVYGSPCQGCPVIPMFVPRVIPGEVHYRFFRWDAEIFYTTGAIIWLADALWVFNRGAFNDKISRFYWGKDLKIIAGNNQLGLTLKF